MEKRLIKIGDTCPHCKHGVLEYVPPDEPWHDEYLICDNCDGTYLTWAKIPEIDLKLKTKKVSGGSILVDKNFLENSPQFVEGENVVIIGSKKTKDKLENLILEEIIVQAMIYIAKIYNGSEELQDFQVQDIKRRHASDFIKKYNLEKK